MEAGAAELGRHGEGSCSCPVCGSVAWLDCRAGGLPLVLASGGLVCGPPCFSRLPASPLAHTDVRQQAHLLLSTDEPNPGAR